MIRIFGMPYLILFFASMAWAEPVIDVEANLKKLIETQVANECATCKVDLVVHNPSIISDIAVPDAVISERWKGQTNIILKVGSENRVVTVTIRWKDQVVIANKNVRQGQVLEPSDLKLVEKDVTYEKTAYMQNLNEVVGLEGRKLFKRGQIIDENYLKKPLVVKYGQPIRLVIDDGSLSLSMTGTARGAGAVGDRIPVFIQDTRKKVSAVIIDKSTARVQ